MTTSFQSMDTSSTFDFSTEHRRPCRFCASWNATCAIRSTCTTLPSQDNRGLRNSEAEYYLYPKPDADKSSAHAPILSSNRPSAHLWFRVDHCVESNPITLLIRSKTLWQEGTASPLCFFQTYQHMLGTLYGMTVCRNMHEAAGTYSRLAKVDASDKLTDNHDVHTLNNLPLETGCVRQVRQNDSRAQICKSSQTCPQA